MFRKIGKVTTLAFATFEGDSFHRIAAKSEDGADAESSQSQPRSFYADGVKKIPIREILSKTAEKFSISPDPSDYIYEAIRANTTNVANENHDAFHKSELLRFDLTAGKPVYRTYEEKPHHVNHRTDNPKTARGVIVDAHYFDETPPLDKCPGCDSMTKEASSRDETGIHCKKCGTVVKDEFVEILVAVDQKKDPLFANAVKTGQLCAGSMGCNCASTTCNVCNHVAYSTNEFCDHIRRGNKGTFWAKDASARGGWRRIEKRAAANELSRRKRRFVLADFCRIKCDDDFEIRKAFEQCNLVEFEEYSRVDQPADPKAKQREILKAAHKHVDLDAIDELELETRALLLQAELQSIQAHMQKAAQMQPSMDVDADMTQDANMGVEGLAILGPDGQMQQLPEGTEIIDDHDLSQDQMQQMQPGMPGQRGPSIEEVTQQVAPGQPAGQQQQWGPEALGILPKASREKKSMTLKPRIFNSDYQGLFAEVTPEGNAVVVSKAGAIMTVTAGKELPTEEERTEFGREVLASILSEGLVDTIRRFDGSLPPRFAQILDAAVNDMEEYHTRPEQPTIHDMEDDRRDDAGREHLSGLPKPIQEPGMNDMESKGDREVSPSTIGDKIVDREDKGAVSPESLSSVEEQKSDMRGKQRPNMSVGKDDILEGSHSDMEANAGAGSESMRTASTHSAAPTHPAIPAATPKGIAEQWGSLDKGHRDVSKERHLDVDHYPNPGGTAFQQGSQKIDKSSAVDAEAAVARQNKLNASRIASIQKEADERVAAAEASIADRFSRAMKIVLRREALNHEESPIKAAMFDVLANEQVVGLDNQTGEELIVGPISADLAQHYTERTFQAAAQPWLERMISRAAELMKSDPGYIASAEADLAKQSAVVPTMTSRAQLGLDEQENEYSDASALRRQAVNGNLHLAPSPEVDDGTGYGFDRKAALSNSLGQAVRLGSSKTNQTLIDLGIQVRPN